MILEGKVTAPLVAAEHSPKGHPALPSVPTLLLKGRNSAPFQLIFKGITSSLPSLLQLLWVKKGKFLVLYARLDSNRNFREGSKGKKTKLLDLYSKNSNDKSEELQIN